MNLEQFYEQILGLKAPWIIDNIEVAEKDKSVHLYLTHPNNSKFPCPKCKNSCSIYDHNKARKWRHLDTCDHYTYLHASLPRVDCLDCGVHTISPDWSDGQSRFTLQFESYIIDVLEQNQVISKSALLLRLAEHQVRYVRDKAVRRGLSRRKQNSFYQVFHLCIDEKSLFKGHHYVTILYDGQTGAVLEVVEHRTIESTNLAINMLGEQLDLSATKVVTMDFWDAFKTAVTQKMPNALIVHDRFHIAQHLNRAVDIVRRAENKNLSKEADQRLKKTKYLWLKNPDKLKEHQQDQLNEILQDQLLKTVRAYQLKEEFKSFFSCKNKEDAQAFFTNWKAKVEKEQIAALTKVAKMIHKNFERIITYFDYKVTNAMAECKNSFIQQIKEKARGFKSAKAFRNAILFFCGKLDLYP